MTAESFDNQHKVFEISTSSSNDDLLDLFAFHVAKDKIKLEPLDAAPATEAVVEPHALA